VRGSLHDVFARFAEVLARADWREFGWFFRVTADCPLISASLARALLAARSPGDDYLYFADWELPRGLAPELVRRAAFESIDRAGLDADEREHVTLPFYRVGSRFRARRVAVPPSFTHPEFRLTLDHQEDMELLRALYTDDSEMEAERAISELCARPELVRLNQHLQTYVPPTARREGAPTAEP
jgi:spore coat polysaccharide biosynthesis protein SpsF